MKITKSQLKQLIKEEIQKLKFENGPKNNIRKHKTNKIETGKEARKRFQKLGVNKEDLDNILFDLESDFKNQKLHSKYNDK